MKIFLAAPFTGLLDPETGFVPELSEAFLRTVSAALRLWGHRVFSAHELEEFGRELDPPLKALVRDFKAVGACDALIAFLGDPPSPGVQLETGFALAKGKPVLALSEHESTTPYLLLGLDAIAHCAQRRYGSVDEALGWIGEFLHRELADQPPSKPSAWHANTVDAPDLFF